jgi:hypothetical protein
MQTKVRKIKKLLSNRGLRSIPVIISTWIQLGSANLKALIIHPLESVQLGSAFIKTLNIQNNFNPCAGLHL